MIDSVSTPGCRGAEHFDDHPLAVAGVRREADHLEDDLVVRLRPLGAGVADVDRVGEDRAVDLDDPHAGLLEVRADEPVGVRASTTSMIRPSVLPHAADLAATSAR